MGVAPIGWRERCSLLRPERDLGCRRWRSTSRVAAISSNKLAKFRSDSIWRNGKVRRTRGRGSALWIHEQNVVIFLRDCRPRMNVVVWIRRPALNPRCSAAIRTARRVRGRRPSRQRHRSRGEAVFETVRAARSMPVDLVEHLLRGRERSRADSIMKIWSARGAIMCRFGQALILSTPALVLVSERKHESFVEEMHREAVSIRCSLKGAGVSSLCSVRGSHPFLSGAANPAGARAVRARGRLRARRAAVVAAFVDAQRFRCCRAPRGSA